MSRLLLSGLTAVALATPAFAHHETPGKSHAVATVTLTEPVKAQGKPLAPGTYEVWILDDQPNLTGAPSNAQRVVELHQNGKMVAGEVAEVFTAGERPIGTSGSSGGRMPTAVVQKLRGGDFIRVAISDAGARYLIYFPTTGFSEPAPQPQSPSRIELPPQVQAPQPVQPER
jgi:hypothetical protein